VRLMGLDVWSPNVTGYSSRQKSDNARFIGPPTRSRTYSILAMPNRKVQSCLV
jgi:hypothetical protein